MAQVRALEPARARARARALAQAQAQVVQAQVVQAAGAPVEEALAVRGVAAPVLGAAVLAVVVQVARVQVRAQGPGVQAPERVREPELVKVQGLEPVLEQALEQVQAPPPQPLSAAMCPLSAQWAWRFQ